MEFLVIRLKTKELAQIIIMSSLAVVCSLYFHPAPNVNFMDFAIFFTGLYFGVKVGALTGGISYLVSAVLSPYGIHLGLLISCMLFESIYGFMGGVIKHLNIKSSLKSFIVSIFGMGLSTLVFDILSTIAFSIAFSIPLDIAFLGGLSFMGLHIWSNLVIVSILRTYLFLATKI